jgi:hypothetical protein
VLKFNPNHGKDGKFSSSGGGGKGSGGGYDRSTATATHTGGYDAVKNPNPEGAVRLLLKPAEPSHEERGDDTDWVLELGRSTSEGATVEQLNEPKYRRAHDKRIAEKARAMAQGVKSWDEAQRRANEAEHENYHAVARIFRSRAKAIRTGKK